MVKSLKYLSAIAFGVLTLGAIGAFAIANMKTNSLIKNIAADSTTHGVSAITSSTLTLDNGFDVAVTTSGFTEGELCSLEQYGYIQNTEPIHGITSITVTTDSAGWVKVMGGWKQYSASDYISYDWDNAGDGGGHGEYTVSFSDNAHPDYFNIYATYETTISAISITYSCSDDTTVGSYRLIISSLTIGEGEDLDADNYVWVQTNIADGSTTANYCLTYDSTIGYYYDFTDLTVGNTGIWFDTYLVRSSTTFATGFKSSDANYSGLQIAPGMVYLSLTATFTSQPSDATYSFTISLTPTWSDGSTTSSDTQIYIAGDSSLISTGTASGDWNYAAMTYSSGSWTYSASDVPAGTYKFKVYAYCSSGTFDWTNASTEGEQSLSVSSSENKTISGTWATQPTDPDVSYTLTITVPWFNGSSGDYWMNINYDDSTVSGATYVAASSASWSGSNYIMTYTVTSDELWFVVYFYTGSSNKPIAKSSSEAYKLTITGDDPSFTWTASYSSKNSYATGTASSTSNCSIS